MTNYEQIAARLMVDNARLQARVEWLENMLCHMERDMDTCTDKCAVCTYGGQRDAECQENDYDCENCKAEDCNCRLCRDEDRFQWQGIQEDKQ